MKPYEKVNIDGEWFTIHHGCFWAKCSNNQMDSSGVKVMERQFRQIHTPCKRHLEDGYLQEGSVWEKWPVEIENLIF